MTEDPMHISIVGLPGSGKTTYLAALWHMVREVGSSTTLTFDSLQNGNYEHVNAIAKRWRQGKIQQRTQLAGMRSVVMRLKNAEGRGVKVSFPDVPGEEFSRMWEKRDLDPGMVDTLKARALLVMVNGDTIQFPAWVAEREAMARVLGLAQDTAVEEVEWSAELAPTQVKIVDLLQMLMTGNLNVGERRLALVFSAWDRVKGEELTPNQLLETKMPLLHQYLCGARDPWIWSVWGVSAQGGLYEDEEKGEEVQETRLLLEFENPSDRIIVVDADEESTDITRPLGWLIS